MSTGQTGHKPGGVPPKFFVFIGFFLSPLKHWKKEQQCGITFFVKGRPKSARQSPDSTVAARRVQSVSVPSSRLSRECHSPRLRSPPLKMPEVNGSPLVIYQCAPCSGRENVAEMGNRDQKKFTKNPRHFFNATFPGKHGKNIHKMFLESRQAK